MSSTAPHTLWHALVRTHHITSQKKVAKLRQAANARDLFVLLRINGRPGVMYAEGPESHVKEWISTVKRLRYKDYFLAARSSIVEYDDPGVTRLPELPKGLFETESMKEYAETMKQRNVLEWWRRSMGFAGDEGRL